MREALNIVKLEQGDDAVILGNNKVPGGVEIISAIDYDQAQINAELSAQAAIKRKQAVIKNNAKIDTPVSLTPKQTSKIDTMDDSVGSSFNRQEPIFGDINVPDNNSKPLSLRVKSSIPLNESAKSNFDWQSDSPSIKDNRVKEEKIEFNSKVHAENLLNSIKDLQTQLTDSHLDTETASIKNVDDLRFQKPQMVNDEMHQASTLQKNLLQESKQTSSNTVEHHVDMQPALDEMKEEMRNMRQLMQCQLTSLDWNKYKQRHPVHSVLLNLLSELGIGSDICERIMNQMDLSSEDPQLMWRYAIGLLSKLLPSNQNKLLDEGGVFALVGSTGVGKTTTIAKIAARFAHSHGKRSVALISTDNFRIGAQEQLQQYAKLLQIPLLTANSSEELSDCLGMLTDKKLVLIDTAGVSQNDMRLSEQFHTLHQGSPEIQPLLVLSANTQLAALNQTIKNFEKVRLAGSIVTKLDEAASLGGVITTSIRHQLPINFCGLGQQVPEDLEVMKSHRLISKAVALMQQYKETPNSETMAMRFNKIVSFSA